MSCCDCESVDLCIPCCDTKEVEFNQCGAVWPVTAEKVVMVIKCPGGCSNIHKEIEGEFVAGPPGKVSFTLGPDITCSLPKGARMCDFRVVAISSSGARMTFITGRISIT